MKNRTSPEPRPTQVFCSMVLLFCYGVGDCNWKSVVTGHISMQLRGLYTHHDVMPRMITITKRVVDMFLGQNTQISLLRERNLNQHAVSLICYGDVSCKYFQNPKDLQNTSLTQWVNPTHYFVKDCKCNIIATSYNFESSFSKTQQHSFCNPKTWIRHEWLVCQKGSNKSKTCHAFAIRHQHVHPQTGLNLNAPLTDVLVEFPHVFASVKVASIRVNILKKRIWKLTYRRYFMKPNEMYIFPSPTIMVQWTTNQLGDKPLIFQRAYTSTEPSLMLTASGLRVG